MLVGCDSLAVDSETLHECLIILAGIINDDGVVINRGKVGKSSEYKWNDALQEVVGSIRSSQKKVGGMYLFTIRQEQPYIVDYGKTSGFNSIWQRFMKKVVDSGIERFTEHDFRAKVASGVSLEIAKELLGHASNSCATERVYRRKIHQIEPAK